MAYLLTYALDRSSVERSFPRRLNHTPANSGHHSYRLLATISATNICHSSRYASNTDPSRHAANHLWPPTACKHAKRPASARRQSRLCFQSAAAARVPIPQRHPSCLAAGGARARRLPAVPKEGDDHGAYAVWWLYPVSHHPNILSRTVFR